MKKIITFGISILVLMTLILNMIPKVYANFIEDGYVMPDVDITKVLTSSDIKSYDPIKMLEVKEDETYKERFGKTYKEDNEAISLDYPIFINNHTAMRFMNNTSYVIDTSFNYVKILEKSILSNQTYFNEDGKAVDTGDYMIVQLPNKLFVSADKMIFKNIFSTQEINKNSIYYFDEDFVNVYEYDEGIYHFKTIRSLQSTIVKVGDLELPYSEFYEKLLQIKETILDDLNNQSQIEDEIKDLVDKDEGKPVGKPTDAIKPDKPVNPEKTPVKPPLIKPEIPEMEYVKPEVEVYNMSSWVYTINGNISIKDPSSRLLGGVVFFVYDEEGKLVLRQSVNKSGSFDLSILEPDKTYVVNASFEYYNKNNLVASEVVLENTILHTIPMEGNIYPVSFNFKQGAYSKPYSMVVENSVLKNTSDYQEGVDTLENFYKNTLPYIHKITFMFEDKDGVISTNVPNRALSSLKNGEKINFETNEILNPKTSYNYIVKAFDKFGNEIKIDPSQFGTYTTSKSSPNVRASVVNSTHDTVELKVQLIDEDNALSADGYEMSLFDMEGNSISFEYEYGGALNKGNKIVFSKSNKAVNIKLFNLPALNRYDVLFTGDYDLENGEGMLYDQEIGDFSFLSGQLPTGTIHFDNEFYEIGDTYATMDLSLSRQSTVELLNLMTDISTSVKGGNQEMKFAFSKKNLDKINIEENYDNSRLALLIQEGNALEGKPEVSLIARKETLVSNGVWKTFLNSGLFGKKDKNAGYIQIRYLKNTLIPKTTYDYVMSASTNINGIKKELNSEYTMTDFTTLTLEPIISFSDFFLAQNFIELYDINAIDEGNTIVDKNYFVQLNEGTQVLETHELKVGEVKDVIRFQNLSPGKKYCLQFVIPQYKPSVNSEVIEQYVIKEFNFVTDEGVSADFNIQSIHSGYDKIHDDKFISNITDIKYGVTFNTTTKTEENDENSFMTDYIPYNKGTYKAFQNFSAPGQKIIVVYYKTDKSYYAYHTLTPTNGLVNDEYCLNYFNNPTIAYMRIVGQTGYEKNARFYDLSNNDLQAIVDVKNNSDVFVDGVAPGTTSFDSTNPSRSTTDFIKVNAGETLYYKSSRTRYLYFYTKDHKYISSIGGAASSQNNIVDVPSNAYYVRYSIENLNKDEDVAALYRIKDMVVKDYEATFNWTIKDNGKDQFVLSNVIDNHQYYIRKYTSNSTDIIKYEDEYTKDYSFETKDDGSVNVYVEKDETLAAKKAYRYDIFVRYRGREIVLDSFEMDTKNTIHLIRNGKDLKQIQYDSFGTFIAVNDIIEDESYYSINANFGGTLDFQNHSLTFYPTNQHSFINDLNPSGVIENIQIIMDSSYERFLVHNNYGRISNINYTIKLESNENLRVPLINQNTKDGIIENFVIQFNGDIVAYNGVTTDRNNILVNTNQGMIRNGYTYNTDKNGMINFVSRQNFASRAGIICGVNGSAGSISNVYAEINIAVDYKQKNGADGLSKSVGIIAGNNAGRVTNVFGIGTRYSFDYNYDNHSISNRTQSHFDDPMFGNVSTVRKASDTNENLIYKNVLFYDTNGNTYDESEMISSSFDIANLYDENWYSTNINSTQQFDVSYISQGYYPLMNSTNGGFVPAQTLNQLPKVKEYQTPEFLDYVVKDTQQDYVDVIFKFNNKSKVNISGFTIVNLDASILEQEMVNDIYEVKVRLTNPKEFVTGYNFTHFTYRTLKGESTVQLKRNVTLDVSFYKVINTIEDWSTWLCNTSTRKLNYNYRLGNTLDFSGIGGTEFASKYRVNATFNGKFDGNGYAIQNINFNNEQPNVNSILFLNVSYAEIKNVEFKNINWNKTSTTQLDNALINTISNSTVDHVNISNVNITGTRKVGGLAVNSSTSNYTNITANGIVLRKNDRQDILYIGGLIADSSMVNIHNSYVRNIDITTERVDLSYTVGIGGMIGNSSTGTRLENVYATGKIKTTSYAGGIAGNGTYSISQAYTDVYMETDGDYNAGIAGTINADASVKNSFSVGNFIHAIESPLHTNRIISSENYWYLNNNYGYVNQTFNNEIKDEKDSSALLTYENFLDKKVYTDKILLSSHYDYEGVSKGILPKLKDTEGKLLPYQNDHYLASNVINVKPLYTEIEPSGDSEFYVAKVQVKHEGYEIDSITIDGMQILDGYPKVEEVTSGSVHNYLIKSYKLKAYDKYNLKIKMHAIKDERQTKELVLSIDYGRPLYWVVKDYTTWQAIMETHGYGSENIMISGNIDFSGKENIYHNITANRFEGDPVTKSTIKGFTLNGSATDSTLISTIYGNIKNVNFEDIKLQFDSKKEESFRYVGIIGIIQGEASQLSFKNCYITGDNGNAFVNKSSSSKVSLINNVGGDLHDIKVENIQVKIKNAVLSGNNYAAGLVSLTYKNVYNIDAKDVYVDAENGFCVGGVVGYADRKSTDTVSVENITLSTTILPEQENYKPNTIKGLHKVGGILGTTNNVTVVNLFAENVEVTGYSNNYDYDGYIGGVVGSVGGTFVNTDKSRPTVKNAKVTAEGYGRAGGVGGSITTARELSAENVEVTSTVGAGGIVGINNSTVTESVVKDAKITAKVGAGGIQGIGYGVSNSRVIDTYIKATTENAGGIVGAGAAYDVHGELTSRYSCNVSGSSVIKTKIETPQAGGGLVGMAYSNGSGASRNFVSHSTIDVGSGGYAGGIIGKGDRYNVYINIVNNNTTIQNKGNHTGGIAGRLDFIDVTTSTYLYQNISAATIEGINYTGGIIGYLDSNITTESRYLSLYSNINMAHIKSNGSHVYGFGTISDRAYNGSKYKYHLVSYENATINGNKIVDNQLSNISNDSFGIVTMEELSDFTTMTSTINQTNYNLARDAWNNMLNMSVRLENFSISFKGLKNGEKQHYMFKVEGVGLNSGDYKLEIKNNLNGQALDTYDIFVNDNGVVSDKAGDDMIVTSQAINNAYMTIYRENNGNKEIYATSECRGINGNLTYHKMKVDGAETESNYRVAKIREGEQLVPNESITLEIDNPGNQVYKWYRLYKGNAYNVNHINITHMANEYKLTTNLPGVYYAQSDDGQHITEMFRYDGVVYYPFVSSSANVPYTGQECIPLAEAYRNKFITKQEPEVVNFPTYQVYSSGVNTINVEFDSTIDMNMEGNAPFNITLNINGKDCRYPVNSRVMTFAYDYCQTDGIRIYLSDANGNKTTTTSHDNNSIRQTISLGESQYYYIDLNGNISGGSTGDVATVAEGEFVHVYGEQAMKLSQDKPTIVNLSSPQETTPLVNGTLLEKSVPLKEDNVLIDDVLHEIEYYRSFMYDKNTGKTNKEMIFNTLSGKMNGYDGEFNRRSNGLVLDFIKVGDEDISVSYCLDQNGKLVFDENVAQLPDKFSNNGISELAFNVNTMDKKYVMIKYPTSVFIWDYETGRVILDEKVKDVSMFSLEGIGQYAVEYFNNFMNFMQGDGPQIEQDNYHQMIQELNKIPNSEMVDINHIALNGNIDINIDDFEVKPGQGFNEEGSVSVDGQATEGNTIVDENVDVNIQGDISSNISDYDVVSRDYVPIYNSVTKSYDIYTTRDIVENKEPMSENAKIKEAIDKGYKLSDVNLMFNKNDKVDNKNFVKTQIILYFGIFTIIVILLFVLKDKIKKLKK